MRRFFLASSEGVSAGFELLDALISRPSPPTRGASDRTGLSAPAGVAQTLDKAFAFSLGHTAVYCLHGEMFVLPSGCGNDARTEMLTGLRSRPEVRASGGLAPITWLGLSRR